MWAIRDQRGITLVELVAAMGIIAVMTALAVLASGRFLQASQIEQTAARLVDDIAIARMEAIAKSQTWRIRFEDPAVAGSTVARRYYVESCATNPCAVWVEEGRYELQPSLGLQVPLHSHSFIELHFSKNGFYDGPTRLLQVCKVDVQTDGTETCQPGSIGRSVRILGNTGVIEY